MWSLWGRQGPSLSQASGISHHAGICDTAAPGPLAALTSGRALTLRAEAPSRGLQATGRGGRVSLEGLTQTRVWRIVRQDELGLLPGLIYSFGEHHCVTVIAKPCAFWMS